MRTAGVKQLVEEALVTLPTPHGEDVIDEVFCAIRSGPIGGNAITSCAMS